MFVPHGSHQSAWKLFAALFRKQQMLFIDRECVCEREMTERSFCSFLCMVTLTFDLLSVCKVTIKALTPHTCSQLLYVEPTVCWPSSRFIFKQNRPRSWTSLVEDLKTNWILLKTIIFLSVYGFANTFTAEKTELLQLHEWHNNICCPIWAWPNQIGPVPFPCIMCLSDSGSVPGGAAAARTCD